jgi:hypothetical protein
MKTYFKTLALALTVFSVGMAKAQTADEIIAKHVEAIGGTEAWSKIKSLKFEGKLSAQGAEIIISRTQIDRKAMRMDISVMGMNGYQILTTTEGWAYMPFQGQTKAEPMTADDVKSSQDELLIQDDFITYKELGKKIEYIGKEEVDGTECFKLKMTDKDGKETTHFVDSDSYLLIKTTAKVVADGKEYETTTTFGNYKKLDSGIVYAMTIGGDWGNTEITKIEINPTIDESVFKPTN